MSDSKTGSSKKKPLPNWVTPVAIMTLIACAITVVAVFWYDHQQKNHGGVSKADSVKACNESALDEFRRASRINGDYVGGASFQNQPWERSIIREYDFDPSNGMMDKLFGDFLSTQEESGYEMSSTLVLTFSDEDMVADEFFGGEIEFDWMCRTVADASGNAFPKIESMTYMDTDLNDVLGLYQLEVAYRKDQYEAYRYPDPTESELQSSSRRDVVS